MRHNADPRQDETDGRPHTRTQRRALALVLERLQPSCPYWAGTAEPSGSAPVGVAQSSGSRAALSSRAGTSLARRAWASPRQLEQEVERDLGFPRGDGA